MSPESFDPFAGSDTDIVAEELKFLRSMGVEGLRPGPAEGFVVADVEESYVSDQPT